MEFGVGWSGMEIDEVVGVVVAWKDGFGWLF